MADIIPFPIKFRPRLIRDGTTPAEDLEYALKMAWKRAHDRAQAIIGRAPDDPPQDGPRTA